MLSQPSVIARLMGMDPRPTSPPETRKTIARDCDCPEEEEESVDLLGSGSYNGGRRDYYYYRRCLDRMKRPLRRDRRWSPSSHGGSRHRHPQEELLGKIREDFQAWLWLHASSSSQAPAGHGAGRSLDVQRIAQANLRREKALLARCGGGVGSECKVGEEEISKNAAEAAHGDSGAAAAAMAIAESEELSASGRGVATRIAILRPAAGGGGSAPLPWKKAGTAEDAGGGMEEFLSEVRERLRGEMAARSAPLSMVAASDGGKLVGGRKKTMLLSRSESFRAFRGDRKRAAAAAAGKPVSPERGKTTIASPPLTKATSRGGRRGGSLQEDMAPLHEAGGDVSPRALFRSFSSPATGFASLPRIIGGGAPDEAGPELTLSSSSRRSRSFSLVRGTAASGLRQSFGVRGKLKRLLLLMHLSKKKKKPSSSSPIPQASFQVDDLAGLAPRSPVSPLEVQGHGHSRRRRHFSLSAEFNFPLPESRSPKCSSEFDAGGSPLECNTSAAAAAAEEEEEGDPDKKYVREVLVAAGLWHGDGGGSEEGKTRSSDVVETTMAMAAPIGEEVFDNVEDAYYFRRCRHGEEECAAADAGDDDEEEEDECGHRAVAARRRLLFDLANEALTQQQQQRRGGGNGVRGKELEDEVWRRATAVDEKDDPAAAAEHEVVGRFSPWLAAAAEEAAHAVGSKLERAIFDDLVVELVRHVENY